MNDSAELRTVAEAAARAGGTVARERFRGQLTATYKPDGSEVTEADHAAQAAVVAAICARRARDSFITEETIDPALCAAAEVTWVIDPIDGTRNYLRGIPLYACSVAAMAAGSPVAAAIYLPEQNELYSTSESEPLLCNGAPVARIPPQPGKWLAGVPSSVDAPMRAILDAWIERFVLRALGSTAMHLALVAAGKLQAAMSCDGYLWDIAAGWLLVQRGGGVTTAPDGAALFPLEAAAYARTQMPTVAAATPEIHREALARV